MDTWGYKLGVPSDTPDMYDADGKTFTAGWWFKLKKVNYHCREVVPS